MAIFIGVSFREEDLVDGAAHLPQPQAEGRAADRGWAGALAVPSPAS
jgi:hypothetical protein